MVLLIGLIVGVIWVLLVIVAVMLCSAAARADAQSDGFLRAAIF